MQNEQEFSIVTPSGWSDYKLIDSGDGEKLEQFGEYRLVRPDPQILWQRSQPQAEWQNCAAFFERSFEDKGDWRMRTKMKDEWPMHWRDLTFMAKLSPFKHTGIFPEQSGHWQWFREILESKIENWKSGGSTEGERPHILNLFAYTGGASIVAAKTGAKVTHVDASRSSIGWAKKNQAASGLDERSIRWILDDVVTFVGREVKRETRYDGIILDPPIYGHGPNGERWDFKKSLPVLLDLCRQVLVQKPQFILINAYAVSTSAVTLGNLLEDTMKGKQGVVSIGELALQQERPEAAKRYLSTGIWARWQANY
jgi:23S rRNA (cytosine1962-C5)-methyltransferase